MRDSQKEIFGIAAVLGLSASSVKELDRLYPSWREDVREIFKEVSVNDEADLEMRVLAVEALKEYDEWEAGQ